MIPKLPLFGKPWGTKITKNRSKEGVKKHGEKMMANSGLKSHARAPGNSDHSKIGSWPALRGILPDMQREATALETLHWCRGHGGGYRTVSGL